MRFGFKICIENGCGKIMEQDKQDKNLWSCKTCKINVCGKCMNYMHQGTNCLTAEDEAYQAFKRRENVLECPNCKANIFKDEGCNHVRCG